ncbi:MAG TPA: mechanosensitive ion channel family protein [Bryobacteraceae bacterium]|jgi:MscS family membrane protein|nr:mechanosensitive ion channel family protein [Bryobacteraceae bacterium]
MPKLLAALLFAVVLRAQTSAPEVKDPLGRTTPQQSIFNFLEACHARDYARATYYLDLGRLSAGDRAKVGPDLAVQLEDLLDDTTFDIATLSRDPEGDLSDLSPNIDKLASFAVNGQTIVLQLEREEPRPGNRIWVVSASSVALIPKAHQAVAETPFEKKLPQVLVTFEILDTPVWRWIALTIAAVALWFIGGFLARALVRLLKPMAHAAGFGGPLRFALLAAGLRMAMEFASPATLSRTFIERGLGLILALTAAWAGAVALDLIAERWRSRLDPRMQAVSYSVLPLGRQILKLTIFLIAILAVLNAWGYNTNAILAGVGVGGIAVALAAQKTIEDLFGGVSVISDRPVLVGDVCRFGDRTGTVMHIGLRSTRIRTPDRTVVSIPNAQFATMTLENISGRDKIWFHPTLNLRRDTTSEQLSRVLASLREILASHPKVETGPIPVRFIGVGAYSLDVEVNAYVKTADFDEFLAVQQELLLRMLQAVEQAGTGLAVPLTESFQPGSAPRGTPSGS